MTTDKKTAEEILTMNGIWNYADNIKISRKDLIELMEKYAYQFKNNTNIDIEDEIRYGNENTAPYHNFNTTPAPIQKGEVDVEKQAENFFNLNYSGTKTSDFLKPYIINTYIQAHSQAKQGGYRKEDIIKCLEAQYIRKGENPRYNEAVKVCITAVQSLPQAHPDHIVDNNKLVKTMSVEEAEWIHVEKDLPQMSDNYMVFTSFKNDGRTINFRIMTSFFSPEHGWKLEKDDTIWNIGIKVTHWMRMPSAPIAKSKQPK